MLKNIKIQWNELGAKADMTAFAADNGVDEFHAIIQLDHLCDTFEEQLARLYKAEELLYATESLKDTKVIFKRYFLSDSANQQPLMKVETSCSVSYIQQPPLNGTKVALWVYLQKGTDVRMEGDMLIAEHNGYKHLWKMGMHESTGDSYHQTETLLVDYEKELDRYGATLADNCIRTWFFVRDVDTQYSGLVKARRENFAQQGLTSDTHYISSTGIGGSPSDTKALVQLGTYALTGFAPEQQQYLYALSHLNRTIEYGVTFERGTLLKYGDRDHAYISGTASIDNKGNVVHVGNIKAQTERMWENVETLLAEGGMAFDDVMQIIVYLRDTADYELVRRMFETKFPNTPYVITIAPVCRPAWLIEMECIAVKKTERKEFKDF